MYNNFTGLGNHSRTTIDILTAEFPEHEYYLYTPKMRLNDVTRPYLHKEGCHTIQPQGLLKGSVWRTYGLAKELKRDGVEVFHGLSNEMPSGLFHSDIGTVVTIHDVAFRTFKDMYHWHDRMIYNVKWRYACEHADRIIAISECTKQDIMRFYNVPEHKISVVYQPVNERYYSPLPASPCRGGDAIRSACNSSSIEGNKGHVPYMLYVGSVNSRKNLLGAVKALEMMPKDMQLPLVVVGKGGEYMQEVKSYVAAHGMERLVDWRSGVDDEQLCELYRGAELFIYPSFYEGFGLPVVEAQLCGCPVVTSKVSSLPEAGGPFAQLVNPHSVEDISEKMMRVLSDSELRQQMVKGGHERAMQTFHPRVLAHQLMELYKNL